VYSNVAPRQDRDGRPGENTEVHQQRASTDVQNVERGLLRKQPLDVVTNPVFGAKYLALLGERELA
jgi:hypothetical protein